MKKITCIGGAAGISTVISGLKKGNNHLSVVYPVTDDGGSTGRLIKDYDLMPMGDLRRLIAAISKKENIITDMLLYRFNKGELKGHALGAIIFTALADMYGDIEKATKKINILLGIKHKIIPSSKQRTTLCAKLENNQTIRGENNIDEVIGFNGNLRIKKLFLSPSVKINPKAKKEITNSDLIVIGPGDLYTSILPNILVSGMKDAIKNSDARVIYITNLMTKFGQTNNFRVSDFVLEIENYLGKNIIDYVIYNKQKPSDKVIQYHKKIKSTFVKIDKENFNKKYTYLSSNLIKNKLYKKDPGDALQRSLIKHNSNKLSKLILSYLK